MLKSFAPLIDKKTRIMVIGTMPGTASLEQGEYYAHKRNAFWKIIAQLFNDGNDFKNYEEKQACLLKNGIGLWDSLQSCKREGSLDVNIEDAVPNDFKTLLAQYPNVTKLLFNGQMAYKFFIRYFPDLKERVSCEIMPSTSPANTSRNKNEIWKSILMY